MEPCPFGHSFCIDTTRSGSRVSGSGLGSAFFVILRCVRFSDPVTAFFAALSALSLCTAKVDYRFGGKLTRDKRQFTNHIRAARRMNTL